MLYIVFCTYICISHKQKQRNKTQKMKRKKIVSQKSTASSDSPRTLFYFNKRKLLGSLLPNFWQEFINWLFLPTLRKSLHAYLYAKPQQIYTNVSTVNLCLCLQGQAFTKNDFLSTNVFTSLWQLWHFLYSFTHLPTVTTNKQRKIINQILIVLFCFVYPHHRYILNIYCLSHKYCVKLLAVA